MGPKKRDQLARMDPTYKSNGHNERVEKQIESKTDQ
jgi:hypothetical protein